jgi:acetylornithine/LysW-gamma-L-lysine aminotransferase
MTKLLRFSAPRGIRVAKASGQYIWDTTGVRYLDFYMGYGAAFLGYRHPKIVEALNEAMKNYMTITPAFDTDLMDKCLESLEKILPPHLGNVFFLNSGSEACEMALKLARKMTRRRKLLAFTNGFHGRTFGALSATWKPAFREGFEPYPFDVVFTPFNNIRAVEENLTEEFAAVILEPVQGEGGIIPAEPAFLKAVEARCRDVGAYMIVDEVQSGFGRTGVVWAHERAGVKPDMLTAAKAVAGGFPASLIAVSDEVASKMKDTDHGSTYGGNPLALAAIDAAVNVLLDENVPAQAEEKGNELGERLSGFVEEFRHLFRDLRRAGLMIGLEMRTQPTQYIKKLQENRLIGFKAGLTVVRFLPPYLITEEDIGFAVEALRKAAEGLTVESKSPENV